MTCNIHKKQRNHMIGDIIDECKRLTKGDLGEEGAKKLIVLAATAAQLGPDTVGDGFAEAVRFLRSDEATDKTDDEIADAFSDFTRSNDDFVAMMQVHEVMVNTLIIIAESIIEDFYEEKNINRANN